MSGQSVFISTIQGEVMALFARAATMASAGKWTEDIDVVRIELAALDRSIAPYLFDELALVQALPKRMPGRTAIITTAKYLYDELATGRGVDACHEHEAEQEAWSATRATIERIKRRLA